MSIYWRGYNKFKYLEMISGGTIVYGTSAVPVTLTAGTPVQSLYTTCSSTSGSTSAEPFYVKSVMTGAGGVGGRARFHLYTNVALGGWSNALKSYAQYGASGRTAGLGSSMCVEMDLSAGTTSGNYAPLEIELNLGTGAKTGTATQLIYSSVNGTAASEFDSAGYFMTVAGLTAGATKCLSLTSQTLKSLLGASTRYLLFSQIADGLGLGNASSAQVFTAGSAPIKCYFTAAGSGSTNCEMVYMKNTLTGTSPVGGRAHFNTYTEVTCGGWVNAVKGYMQFGTSGRVTGLASAVCAEMYIDNGSLGSGGAYIPLEVELVYGGSSVVSAGALSGNHVAFATYRFSGDTDGDFDDNGFFFTITGLTAGTGHIFHTDNATGTIAGSLKIGIGTDTYYIPLWSTEVQHSE